MAICGGQGLHHQRLERRDREPMGHALADDAAPPRYDPGICGANPPLAGNHQKHPRPIRMGGEDKIGEHGLRPGNCHAMEIDPPIRAQSPLAQTIIGFAIHIRGRPAQIIERIGAHIHGDFGILPQGFGAHDLMRAKLGRG